MGVSGAVLLMVNNSDVHVAGDVVVLVSVCRRCFCVDARVVAACMSRFIVYLCSLPLFFRIL